MVARPLCEGLSTEGQAQRQGKGWRKGARQGPRQGQGRERQGGSGQGRQPYPKNGVGSFQGHGPVGLLGTAWNMRAYQAKEQENTPGRGEGAS